MNYIAENIKQRLSLREPLKESLDILTHLTDVLELKKEVDLKYELEKVRALYPTCTDFERTFPSICFSIATGVGKTRLMGACIAYLYIAKGVRNFFVLAPNLTIYNKLIDDFGNISNPKYVFKGIAEFVNNRPVIITGDNYKQQGNLMRDTEMRINVFNVAKFSRETKPAKEDGGKNMTPRIKRLSEYLGQSYWEHLTGLNDLVILMDEAHRYHADKSKAAINELKPILGIELSATPVDEKSNPFRNVVYEYSLARALSDGLYVKNPTIATRQNYTTLHKTEEDIERIKLEDAVNIHNDTKTALAQYALEAQTKLVKPFIFVVCKDTTHAKSVFDYVSSTEFFEGAFANKVLQIDSTTRDDEHIDQQFIDLEKTESNIEIVIHVNMLKEGWDVTNLYTIVPLRAANAVVLIEQTIGRGLRLPFNGQRTGNEKVDKLTIVAHDNFNKIVDAAKDPNSILNKMNFIELDANELTVKNEVVTVKNNIAQRLDAQQKAVDLISDTVVRQEKQIQLQTEKTFFEILPQFNKNVAVSKIDDLNKPEVKAQVLKAAESELHKSGQIGVFDSHFLEELATNYTQLIADFKRNIIEIPQMVIAENKGVATFEPFDLDTESFNHFEELNDQIYRRGLMDNAFDVVEVKTRVKLVEPVSVILSQLINYNEIDYDGNAELLQNLAQKAVTHISQHKKESESIKKIVFDGRQKIGAEIYRQMMLHFKLEQTELITSEVLPFVRIENWNFTVLKNQERKNFKVNNIPDGEVKKYIFNGYNKSCHAEYKFDSSPEFKLAYILETDTVVLKWLRPAPNQFRIYWSHSSLYEPDFVAETSDFINLLEVKRADQLQTDEVINKKRAAIKYCENANQFIAQHGGKLWRYILIPDSDIQTTKSFKGVTSGNIKS